MRRLILMRHGKSAWDDPALTDHARVLNARGRRACDAIGVWLKSQGHIPDQVLCSSAARTVETWQLVSRHLGDAPEAQLMPELYLAAPDTMAEALRSATGRTVAMIGHNPGTGELAAGLAATRPARPEFARYPTLATLVLEFDIKGWSGLQPGQGRLVDFIVSRDLTD